MADRATPVQVAKTLNIRPQIIYGLIKRGKVATFPNPNGKADLVDVAETRIVVSRMSVRGPRKEKAARTGRSPVKRGQILSRDKFPVRGVFGRKFGGGRSIEQVIDPGQGEGTLAWTTDGMREKFWETETLAGRLKREEVRIEHIGSLLGMIMFQWRELEDEPALADSLEQWCKDNGVITVPLKETEEKEHDDQEGEVIKEEADNHQG